MVLALVLALLAGLSMGLLGAGGSMLTVPILVYVLGIPAGEAAPTALLVVGGTAAFALLRHAPSGRVRWRLGLGFGATSMAGGYLGGRVAFLLSDRAILSLFALVALAASGSMLFGSPSPRQAPGLPSTPLLGSLGFSVGTITGLVAAGGGFVVVPSLVFFAGIPMHEAVATSLLVISMNALAGVLGHLHHASIDLSIALPILASAALGTGVGVALSSQVSGPSLRRAFGVLVLVIAVGILGQQAISATSAPSLPASP